MKPEIVLFGDSIFDNAAYTKKGKAVIDYLKKDLGDSAEAGLFAIDGSVTKQVTLRLDLIPPSATHIFISSGGNDALHMKTMLDGVIPANLPEGMAKPLSTMKSGKNLLHVLAVIQQEFRLEYRKMLEKAMGTGLPVTVCTIYDKSPMMEVWHRAALTVFNDVITYEAAIKGASLIDLRAVCDHPGDYSSVSPIEPSEQGSAKIAGVIKRVLDDQLGGATGSRIYV